MKSSGPSLYEYSIRYSTLKRSFAPRILTTTSACSVYNMSLDTNANPTSSPDMKAETKSPRIEMTELSSSSVPNSISDNDFRLGDPFLEDFYDSGMPDQRNLIKGPASLKSQVQLLDVYKGGIS
jgi:hypothetical protein